MAEISDISMTTTNSTLTLNMTLIDHTCQRTTPDPSYTRKNPILVSFKYEKCVSKIIFLCPNPPQSLIPPFCLMPPFVEGLDIVAGLDVFKMAGLDIVAGLDPLVKALL